MHRYTGAIMCRHNHGLVEFGISYTYRWARGKTRSDHIRNEDIRKEAHIKAVETFLKNKRLGPRVFWPSHMCEIAETRGFWEKEQRSTEKEIEGQHKRRH